MEKLNREIERKFIINSIPDEYSNLLGKSIKQGYIFSNENFEIRLRKKEDKYYQTIKEGKGIERTEVEIELTENQFNKLWMLTKCKRVEKKRFEIKYHEHIIELDIFSGELENLIIAEIEFENIEIANNFELPDWFDKEVTLDENYKNKNLAINGIPVSCKR